MTRNFEVSQRLGSPGFEFIKIVGEQKNGGQIIIKDQKMSDKIRNLLGHFILCYRIVGGWKLPKKDKD